MTNLARFCLALCGGMLIACQPLASDKPVAAVIKSHNVASLQELQKLMSQATGAPVKITATAFTQSYRLTLENAKQRTLEQGVLDGKQLIRPPVFSLSLQQSLCYLTDQKSQQRWLLKEVDCVAAPLKN